MVRSCVSVGMSVALILGMEIMITQTGNIDIQGIENMQDHMTSDPSKETFSSYLDKAEMPDAQSSETIEKNKSDTRGDDSKINTNEAHAGFSLITDITSSEDNLEIASVLDMQKTVTLSETDIKTKDTRDMVLDPKTSALEGIDKENKNIGDKAEIELPEEQNQGFKIKDPDNVLQAKERRDHLNTGKRDNNHKEIDLIYTEKSIKEDIGLSKEELLKFVGRTETVKTDHLSLLDKSMDNTKVKDSVDSVIVSKEVHSGFENENLQMISLKSSMPLHQNNRAENINQIINYIIQVSKSPNRFGVSIKEHTLGRLDISVSMHKGVINININVSNHLLRDMIQENIQTILDNLYNEGLNIGGFSVSVKNQQREEIVPSRDTYLNDERHEDALIITGYSERGLISVFV